MRESVVEGAGVEGAGPTGVTWQKPFSKVGCQLLCGAVDSRRLCGAVDSRAQALYATP